MKNTLKIMHTLAIAIWPTSFLLIVGLIERGIRRMATLNAEPKYYAWVAIVYIFSGLIFASISYRRNANNRCIVISYIVAELLIVTYSTLWILCMTGVIWSEDIANICSSTPLGVVSLVFGHTSFFAIKAVCSRRNVVAVNGHRKNHEGVPPVPPD